MPPLDSAPVDFDGLSNQAPRAAGYGQVLSPDSARDQSDSAYQQATFQLQKPARPYILKRRAPGVAPQLV